jgi:hypothetical protein
LFLDDRSTGMETSGTSLALPDTLAPDQFYWGSGPDELAGGRSAFIEVNAQ